MRSALRLDRSLRTGIERDRRVRHGVTTPMSQTRDIAIAGRKRGRIAQAGHGDMHAAVSARATERGERTDIANPRSRSECGPSTAAAAPWRVERRRCLYFNAPGATSACTIPAPVSRTQSNVAPACGRPCGRAGLQVASRLIEEGPEGHVHSHA
jgi:hypothetical protein